MYRLWKRSLKYPEKAYTCLLLFRKDAGFLRIRLNEFTSSWMEPSRFEGVILRQAEGFTIITHAANEPESSHFAVQFHQYSLHGIMRLLPGLAMHMRPATNFSSRLFACVLERLPQEFGAWNRVAKSSGYIEHNDVPDLIRPVLFTIPSGI